jgi:lipid II:glycine glycyltransferase (peptidoglycan interpeptide bridge formation enzyme)
MDYTNFQLLSQFTIQLKKYLRNNDVVAVKISPMILKKQTDKDSNIIYSNPEFDNYLNI